METLFSLIVGKRGAVVLKVVLGHFNTFIKILDECRCVGTFYGRVELGEVIFWVSVVEWTFLIGMWVWLEVYFGRVGLGGHFLSVGGDKWGVGGGIFWVDRGGWTIFMSERGWVEMYFGWEGLSGHFLWGGWTFLWVGGSGWRQAEVYFG